MDDSLRLQLQEKLHAVETFKQTLDTIRRSL
jgi:hypothetical protein